MKRWKKTRPYKREYVVDGATFYMSLSKTMIVLGNSDGLAKILWQDTGEEVWTMQCEDIAVQQEALAHRLYHLQHLTACKIQNGHQGAPKFQRRSKKVSTPRFLGILINFR